MLAALPHLRHSALWLEPSAGNGSFVEAIQGLGPRQSVLAFDVEPHAPGIKRRDFLDVLPGPVDACIGNPPFGYQCKGVVDFFNAAAQWSDYIGFIMPVAANRVSVTDRLNPNYWRLASVPIVGRHNFHGPDGALLDKSGPHLTEFQVWKRFNKTMPRQRWGHYRSQLFQFVKPDEPHDFCVRKIGANPVGIIVPDRQKEKDTTHLWVKVNDQIATVEYVRGIWGAADFSYYQRNIVTAACISPAEISMCVDRAAGIFNKHHRS